MCFDQDRTISLLRQASQSEIILPLFFKIVGDVVVGISKSLASFVPFSH